MTKPATHQDLTALPKALLPLAEQRRWVNWAWEERTNKAGTTKWTKPPLQPRAPQADAESDNPTTWSTYDQALRRVTNGDADGVGFMLLGADIGAVDLDCCCTHDLKSDELRVDPWAAEIETDGYVEVTVSGRGLRIIGRAKGGALQRRFNLENNAGIELFRNTPRYITISGLEYSQCRELPPIDDFLDELLTRYDTGKKKKSAGAQGNRPNGKAQEPQGGGLGWLIDGLGGNPSTCMCACPAHHDPKPSLLVRELNGRLFHCFAGCSYAAVIEAPRARNLWPIPDLPNGSSRNPTGTGVPVIRSAAESLAFALCILRDTEENRGRELAQELLPDYFKGRGIERVPPTAMLGRSQLVRGAPSIIFEVTNGQEVVGCHVTWLSFNKKTKRDPSLGDPRKTFGLISGGYVKLYSGELDPTAKLIIGEGIESSLAAAQIAGGLPAIAAISAGNLPTIEPPPAREYLVAADNDGRRGGVPAARALTSRLVQAGHLARLVIPPRVNSDWNDELLLLLERVKL